MVIAAGILFSWATLSHCSQVPTATLAASMSSWNVEGSPGTSLSAASAACMLSRSAAALMNASRIPALPSPPYGVCDLVRSACDSLRGFGAAVIVFLAVALNGLEA